MRRADIIIVDMIDDDYYIVFEQHCLRGSPEGTDPTSNLLPGTTVQTTVVQQYEVVW